MKLFRAPRLWKVLLVALTVIGLARWAKADEASDLAAGLTLLRAGQGEAALAAAGATGSVARDLVLWHLLREGKGDFAAYTDFVARRADWPGLPLLMKKGEAAIPVGHDPAAVLAWFAREAPQTGTGTLRAIEAHMARGEVADAEALAVLAWRDLELEPGEEADLLALFPRLLSDHHVARLDALLWEGRTGAAERLLPRVPEGWQALASARIALRRDRDGVDALIAKVPPPLADDPGLAFERFLWRKRKDRDDDAATLMADRSATVESLGRPEAWAADRRVMARALMRQGKPREAYRLASRHGLTEGSDYADLEWLSGFLALRRLDDAATAYRHFANFRQAVFTPISLGRAGYWEGRALEAMGRPIDAQAAYEFGAEFQTSFYGLLAAEKAGLPMDPALAGTETWPDWRQAAFLSSSVAQAALLLQKAGERDLCERFLRHLAESLDAAQMGQMADMVLDLGEPHLALSVAKLAADRGIVLNRPYYPVTGLAKAKLPVPAELALSIARRESEFDPVVVSPAGARGLMQLMPATAKAMAKKVGEDFALGRLTSDPDYNARLGTRYLADLIEKFGANPMLVAAAYNAGPSRPERWIRDFGDPRSDAVDAIDWIETIPFEETRNYVMRVTESIPVYRARLSGKTGQITLSADLEGR
jgi:soluble lytic murein transglycosylase